MKTIKAEMVEKNFRTVDLTDVASLIFRDGMEACDWGKRAKVSMVDQ